MVLDDSVVGKRGRGRPKKEGSYDRALKFCVNEDHKYMKRALEDEIGRASCRERVCLYV